MRTIVKFAVAASLALAPSGRAQTTYSWTSTSGNANWNDTTRWSSATVPVSGSSNTIEFNMVPTADFTATNNLGNLQLQTLNLNGNAAAARVVTIAGSTSNQLQFAGASNSITRASANANLSYVISARTTITNGLTIDLASSRLDYDGIISGSGGLIKNGGGQLRLNATNTYTGGTTVNAGRLIFEIPTAIPTGTITLNGGILTYALASAAGTPVSLSNSLLFGGNAQIVDSVNIQGSHPLTFTGGVSLGGSDRALTIDNTSAGAAAVTGNSVALTNVVSNGGLVKAGPGTLILSNAASTYSGDTVLRRGTLMVENNSLDGVNGALGNSSSAIQLGDSGTVSLNTIRLRVGSGFTLGRAISVNNQNGAGESSIGNSSTSGTATFSGAISLNKGVTLLSNAGSTSAFSGLIDDGAGSFSVSVGSAGGSGVVNLNRAAGNTYDGGTVVSFGTLLVNNTSGSGTGTGPVTVSAGATLGGSGTIAGDTSISGNHSPGNSPGVQTFGSDLTYNNGATVLYELIENTSTQDNPAVFDQIVVGGDLAFGGATTLNLAFDLSGSAVDWSNSFWNSTQSWLIYDVAGSTTGFGNLSLASINWLDGQGDAFNTVRGGASFAVNLSGENVYLNYTPVPEPSVCALLVVGLLGVLRRKRRSL